jgi:hypothetical protein
LLSLGLVLVLVLVFQVSCSSLSLTFTDFRGPNGVWTKAAQGVTVDRNFNMDVDPTLAHMSLIGLQRAGILKGLVSTNTDGISFLLFFILMRLRYAPKERIPFAFLCGSAWK